MLCKESLVYGLVFAVDIEGYSRLSILDQIAILARLREVLEQAAERACLVREEWNRQSRGDGELAVLPPDTDVACVVADFTHYIVEELKRASRPKLRVRISMDYGTLTRGAFGPVGEALIIACRLLDAKATREALASDLQNDVVIVVSQRLYQDVVATRFRRLQPERFHRLSERVGDKTYRGYICAGSPREMGRVWVDDTSLKPSA